MYIQNRVMSVGGWAMWWGGWEQFLQWDCFYTGQDKSDNKETFAKNLQLGEMIKINQWNNFMLCQKKNKATKFVKEEMKFYRDKIVKV